VAIAVLETTALAMAAVAPIRSVGQASAATLQVPMNHQATLEYPKVEVVGQREKVGSLQAVELTQEAGLRGNQELATQAQVQQARRRAQKAEPLALAQPAEAEFPEAEQAERHLYPPCR
jgi:hypothetical protein